MTMSAIVCGQDAVLGGICPECGGSLHRVARGGFPDQYGMRYCDEDCIAEYQHRCAEDARRDHLAVRDLMCACEVCAAAGHPTGAERAEWQAYLDGDQR